MTIPAYEIEYLGLDEQMALFRAYPEVSSRELSAAMQKSVLTIEGAILPFVPVDRGRLRSSIGSQVTELSSGNLEGKVGSSMKDERYPQVMEFGREPGSRMPPLEPLEAWVRRVIKPDEDQVRRIAYLVARKIVIKGIKAREYMKKGWEKSEDRVKGYFVEAIDKITEAMSNGRN